MRELVAQAYQELDACVERLLKRERFYAHLLFGVKRRVSLQVRTVCLVVDADSITLALHPEFFCVTLPTRDMRVAVLKHELLHLVFGHPGRKRGPCFPNATLYNMAADLVVNQYIGTWPLPDGAFTLKSLPVQLPGNMTLDWYYDWLAEHVSGTGGLAEVLNTERAGPGEHGRWGDQAVPATVKRDQLAKHVRRAKRAAGSHGWGRLPGQVKEAIGVFEHKERTQLDWRHHLRAFAGAVKRDLRVHTRRRPSRRYSGDAGWIRNGTFHGDEMPVEMPPEGLKARPPVPDLVVAIDTSGSVSNALLKKFFEEVHRIWEHGTRVTVVECDAKVQCHWQYTGTHPKVVMGRGGTDFTPVFQWMRKQQRRWSGCIYLTDGHALAPTVAPPCKLLWVVSSRFGMGKQLTHGRAILLEPDNMWGM